LGCGLRGCGLLDDIERLTIAINRCVQRIAAVDAAIAGLYLANGCRNRQVIGGVRNEVDDHLCRNVGREVAGCLKYACLAAHRNFLTVANPHHHDGGKLVRR
jgi:hypothetical protein